MDWATPWIIYLIGASFALTALWIVAPHVPGLRFARANVERVAHLIAEEFRKDPPPVYFVVRDLIFYQILNDSKVLLSATKAVS